MAKRITVKRSKPGAQIDPVPGNVRSTDERLSAIEEMVASLTRRPMLAPTPDRFMYVFETARMARSLARIEKKLGL